MTENMRKFIRMNRTHKVIDGGHVTKEGQPVTNLSNLNDSIGVRYMFTNGEQALLTKMDVKSAPEYSPVWDI